MIGRAIIAVVVGRTIIASGERPADRAAVIAPAINVAVTRIAIEAAATGIIAIVVGVVIQFAAGLRTAGNGIAARLGGTGNGGQGDGGNMRSDLPSMRDSFAAAPIRTA